MRGGKLETQGEQGSRIPTTLLAAPRTPKSSSSRSSSTWRKTPTFNRWKQSSSVVMVPLLKKGLEVILQSILSSPAATLGNASGKPCPGMVQRRNSGRLSRRVPGRTWKPSSLKKRGFARTTETQRPLQAPLWKLVRESRMPETPRLQSVLRLMEAYPLSSTLPPSHGLREEGRRPRISSELCSSTGAQ